MGKAYELEIQKDPKGNTIVEIVRKGGGRIPGYEGDDNLKFNKTKPVEWMDNINAADLIDDWEDVVEKYF